MDDKPKILIVGNIKPEQLNIIQKLADDKGIQIVVGVEKTDPSILKLSDSQFIKASKIDNRKRPYRDLKNKRRWIFPE